MPVCAKWDLNKMTPQDQQRIEFAERFGLRRDKWPSYNDLHNALMGMNDEEWDVFESRLAESKASYFHKVSIREVLQTPLPTLVSCFMEATKGRVK